MMATIIANRYQETNKRYRRLVCTWVSTMADNTITASTSDIVSINAFCLNQLSSWSDST